MVFARRLVDLVLFRRGPQDMPGDQNTLIGTAVVYCIVQFVQVLLLGGAGVAFLQAALATLLLGGYAALVLRLRQLANRFTQTATALFGSGALLTLLMLAPTLALGPYIASLRTATDPSQVTMPSPLAALAYLIIGFWGLAIYSHIYRHALNVPIAMGVAVTIGFEALVLLVFSALG